MKIISFLKKLVAPLNIQSSLKIVKITGSIQEKNVIIYYKLNGATGGYWKATPFELITENKIGEFTSDQAQIIYQLSFAQAEQPDYFIKNTIHKEKITYIIICEASSKEDFLFTLDELHLNKDIFLGLSKKDINFIYSLDKSTNTTRFKHESMNLKLVKK